MKACSARTLGEVAEIVMGQSPPGASCNTEGIGIPLLNGPTEFGSYHPAPVQFTTTARKRARPGDLLFCVRGSTTGRMNWADREYAIGRGVAAIRHRLYLELQPFVRAVIEYNLPELLAQATGSTFPNVSANQLAGLWWPPLPLSEQRAIAHILGTLDDKIELNRKMNQTLEALAQTEFKRMMREGGNACSLGELATIQGGKQLPTEDCKPRGTFPVFGANGLMGYAEQATHNGFVIAFGRVGAYCGSIHWTYGGGWINNNASSVVPHCWPEFVLQAMLAVDFHALRTGSAQPFIPNNALAALEIEVPPSKRVEEFCTFARPIRLKQETLAKESRTLAALRDALLPKLVSGEIRVRDAERFLKERGL